MPAPAPWLSFLFLLGWSGPQTASASGAAILRHSPFESSARIKLLSHSADFLPSLAPLLCTDFVGVYGLHSTSLPVVSLLVVVACVALRCFGLVFHFRSFSLVCVRSQRQTDSARLHLAVVPAHLIFFLSCFDIA